MITGRHYHSSCSFKNNSVYVFCGISNETKKYLNTVERMNINTLDLASSAVRNQWESLVIQDQAILSARQGQGVCQSSDTEILIVGGFHG
jgi:hypothetical protein